MSRSLTMPYVFRVNIPHIAIWLYAKEKKLLSYIKRLLGSILYRKYFRRLRNVLTPIVGRAVLLLYLKTIQILILSSERKECIYEENDALDDTERTFSQTGITKR